MLRRQLSDVPGCISAGDMLEEAAQNAVEASSGRARMIEADGETSPPPRGDDAIVATRINVSLDRGLLAAIDAAARLRGQTRSAFIASAVQRELVE